jgi:hypothetical protein
MPGDGGHEKITAQYPYIPFVYCIMAMPDLNRKRFMQRYLWKIVETKKDISKS